MLFLDLDDAMKVLQWNECSLSDDMTNEDWEYIRNELEQKCFITSKDDTLRNISQLACDINPKEIASHIEDDTLGQWCEVVQAELNACAAHIIKESDE